uniref:Uncharacterized protein n=1 Tax=Lotus japonicus TaxID=34305 RepID=I3SA55_LOTJA|nr:unknown [Lotus japonicus]
MGQAMSHPCTASKVKKGSTKMLCLFGRTSVQGRTPFFVVFLMVMDLMAIGLRRKSGILSL